ncbi:MAG: hypothetical protein CMJ64_15455 [Planctomycetaceae bacterium]|nr:hypothetical protein [Planctomycetaceae bacterium]
MVFDVLGSILVSTRQQVVTRKRNSISHNASWIAAYSICWTVFAGVVAAEETYDLSVKQATSGANLVKAIVEVSGKLKLNADGTKVSELPLRVRGELEYAERTIEQTQFHRKNARLYETARATIQVGDTRLESSLNEERRLVLAQVKESQHTLCSPQGPITRDELELIDIQGSTTLSHLLTPAAPVPIGAEWPHEADLLTAILGLDAIAQADVKSIFRKVEGDIAIIDMSGEVSGAVDGVSSDIVLKAKYNVDLKSHSITWLAMSIHEDRAIGHATPGFEVTARIRVATTAQETPLDLTDDALAGLPLELSPGSTLLSLLSPTGGFQLLHAREWQVMVDRADVTILRFVEQGDLIAQCNVSSLPDSMRGERVSLEAFRADIEKALGKNFGQFVEASQQTNDQGLRVLRVVVSGVASELPIQWIYYHISTDDVRQAALVFTMDGKVVEKFAGADEALVNSFEFAQRVLPGGDPTPASIEKPDVDRSVR